MWQLIRLPPNKPVVFTIIKHHYRCDKTLLIGHNIPHYHRVHFRYQKKWERQNRSKKKWRKLFLSFFFNYFVLDVQSLALDRRVEELIFWGNAMYSTFNKKNTDWSLLPINKEPGHKWQSQPTIIPISINHIFLTEKEKYFLL